MYYIYVLHNEKTNGYYIGYTKDLKRRFAQHKRKFPDDTLCYYEAYLQEASARGRERKLKYYGSAWRALRKRISA